MTECLFCKIINKQVPATILFENDDIIAFRDIYPKASVHFLVVPKLHIESMLSLKEEHKEIISQIMLVANKLAVNEGLGGGYRLQVNTGLKGGQEIFHLHVHVLGNK